MYYSSVEEWSYQAQELNLLINMQSINPESINQ